MLTPIILEYNKKYLKLESLYKLNLYYIDNEYYIDMIEIKKIFTYFVNHFDNTKPSSVDYEYSADSVKHEYIDNEEQYNEEERMKNDCMYIERPACMSKERNNIYQDISIENYLLNLVETTYKTMMKTFKKYEDDLNDLNNFKKPCNVFKQIISENGEIIYVINFKKIINNVDNIRSAHIIEDSDESGDDESENDDENKELVINNFNIKIEIETLFDVNKLYPLDLKKILTERQLKVSSYTEL